MPDGVLPLRGLRREAWLWCGVYVRSTWNSFDCTINQRSEGMIQQGLRQMFSGMQNTAESFLLTLYKIGIAQLQGTFWTWQPPHVISATVCTAGGSLLYLKVFNSLRATVNINF